MRILPIADGENGYASNDYDYLRQAMRGLIMDRNEARLTEHAAATGLRNTVDWKRVPNAGEHVLKDFPTRMVPALT